MQQTSKLTLYKPEESDDIIDSLNKISQNFQTVDDSYIEETSNLSLYLSEGLNYTSGFKIWNGIPQNGGAVGWVNVRNGKHAPKWIGNRIYNSGEYVTNSLGNGHIYQCVSDGWSGVDEPLFPVTPDTTVNDLAGESYWVASKPYKLNDIAIPINGNRNYYYKCIVAGTSNVTEPSWSTVNGSTVNDGTVVWLVRKTVVWKEFGSSCLFMPFGDVKQSNTYEHNQTQLSTTWDIIHNLNKYPSITILDDTNDLIYGNIEYIDLNQVRATFSIPIKGKCFVN